MPLLLSRQGRSPPPPTTPTPSPAATAIAWGWAWGLRIRGEPWGTPGKGAQLKGAQLKGVHIWRCWGVKHKKHTYGTPQRVHLAQHTHTHTHTRTHTRRPGGRVHHRRHLFTTSTCIKHTSRVSHFTRTIWARARLNFFGDTSNRVSDFTDVPEKGLIK